jgi:DNA transformation protein
VGSDELIESMRNLGPRSAQQLASVGINTVEKLRAMGAVAAYVTVQRGCSNIGVNMLWALQGALTNRHWEDAAREFKDTMLPELEQYEKDHPPP